MSHSLRIAVADDEPLMRRWYQQTLSKLGHDIVVCAANGQELVEMCNSAQFDLVISDIKMPELDGIDAVASIREAGPVPVILVSAYHENGFIQRALEQHVLAYFVKPIKQADLETALALVMRRWQEFDALQKQADNLSQALEDRKLIERAKGVLMKRADLEEGDAFRRLQRISQERNEKLVDVARTILTADQAFG